MADKYVDSRSNGLPARSAARVAGYSDTTKIIDIEKPGGPVANKLAQALKSKGIDEDYLAREYKDIVSLSKTQEKGQLNAGVRALLQLSDAMGYKNREPKVAVQINNNLPGSNQQESRTTSEIIEELREFGRMVRSELAARGPGSVPTQDAEIIDAEPCEGVVGASDDGEVSVGRGES